MSILHSLAEHAEFYQYQLDKGEISFEEFKELVADLNILEYIEKESSELDRDEKAREILLAIIKIAGIVY